MIKMGKKIIFDTDLGGDCDDVMALDLLLSAHDSGECELLGVTYSADARSAPQCIFSIMKYHGHSDIPIGCIDIPSGIEVKSDIYASKAVKAFPYPDAPSYESTPKATDLLRKLLSENKNVHLVVTGFLSNLSDLLDSDEGVNIVMESVSEITVMGCNFSHINGINPELHQILPNNAINAVSEWNIYCDIKAAQKVFELSPVPIVILPFEVGFNMITGKPMIDAGKGETPDSFCYIEHGSVNGRHSWDPAAALYAIYGAKPWFYKTASGCVTINNDGTSDFTVCKGGLHSILECAVTQAEIADEIDNLVMRLYR